MRIIYKKDANYFIGLLDELVTLGNSDSQMIRRISEAQLDFSGLITAISKADPFIDSVEIVLDDSLSSYQGMLADIPKVNIVDEAVFSIQASQK